MFEYAINITARTEAIERIGTAARKMGGDVNTAVDSIAARMKQGVVGANDLNKSIMNVGRGNGFSEATTKAKGYIAAVHQARKSTEGVRQTAEEIRNIGIGFGAAGIGGLMLSRNLIRVSEEGRGVEARLESILKQQNRLNDMGSINDAVGDVTVKGHFADDDEIRDSAVKLASFNTQTKHMGELLELSARQARTMGTDVAGVAEQLGKVYGTGKNIGGLTKSGVAIDQAEIDRIKEAYEISKEMGQMKFMEIIGPAIINNTVALADSLTETQKSANDAARAMDDFQTAAGKGAANAQKTIDGLGMSLLSVVSQNPAVAEGAGAILTYGSYAATAAGSVVGFAGSLGQAVLAFNALKGAKAVDVIATGAGTTATNINTAAVVANGNAALAASLKFKALGAARLLGVAGAGILLGGAVYEATRGEDDPGAMEAAGNAWATTKRAFGFNAEITQENGLTESQNLENARLAMIEKQTQKRLKESIGGIYQTPDSGMIPSRPDSPIRSVLAPTDNTDEDTPDLDAPAVNDKAQKSALKASDKAQRESDKARKAADKAGEKERKAVEKAEGKDREAWIKFRSDRFDDQADLRIAAIEESFATRIASLSAAKTDDNEAKTEYEIARLEAAKLEAVAGVFKDGEGEIEFEQKKRMAKIRAGGMIERAGITFNKAKSQSTLAGASQLKRSDTRTGFGNARSANGTPFGMAPRGGYGEQDWTFASGGNMGFGDKTASRWNYASGAAPSRSPRKIPLKFKDKGYDASGNQIFEVIGKIVVGRDDGFMGARA